MIAVAAKKRAGVAPAAGAGLASCIYEGEVRHRRYSPRGHAFRMSVWMLYLDLGETDRVFGASRLWSDSGHAPARFRREDYLGDAGVALEEAVRARVEDAAGVRPAGPVRMLAHVRQWGYVFNPVTFYYCFDAAGERVEWIVAEITNTPWGERHSYVLDAREGGGRRSSRFVFEKAFHVSPFMPMDVGYDWSFTRPGGRLGVHMALWRAGARVFDADLRLSRREIDARAVRRVLARQPLMTARVIGRIHWEALRLWLKRVAVHPHPEVRRRRGARANGAEGR